MYRFTNTTGRTSLTKSNRPTVLVINGNPVRPEEVRQFDVPTADICRALESGSIVVEKNRAGSWVPVISLAGFDGFVITKAEKSVQVSTVDGVRTSTLVDYTVYPEGAVPESVVAPEAPAVEVPAPVAVVVEEAPGFPAPEDEAEPEVAEDPEPDEVPGIDAAEAATATSADFNAKDAVAYIEATPAEELEDFLSEGESRKSVLAAWEAKVGN